MKVNDNEDHDPGIGLVFGNQKGTQTLTKPKQNFYEALTVVYLAHSQHSFLPRVKCTTFLVLINIYVFTLNF